MTTPAPAQIVDFWIEAGPEKWFKKDDAFDRRIRDRFAGLHEKAVGGAHDNWLESAQGALALVVVLDQFSRNLYRGSPRAYEADAKSCAVAEEAIARGHDKAYDPPVKRFFYLPFMHAEELRLQELCIRLCDRASDESGAHYARHHADIIRRFGRFPHRNDVLGRISSESELAFLSGGGFAG